MLDLYEELASIVDALENHGVPYALCGGIAMSVHGFTRATVDIDLFLPAEAAERAEAVVAPLGYTFPANPMNFSSGAVQIRRVSKIDLNDGDLLMLDLLLVTPATQEVWLSREVRMWRARPIQVVSREGLITLKRFRSSMQDLADIERLEGGE
ncbi:MAG TPA: hypothetical protein VEK57_15795 [Thermoanaerobaculia bacterium]|nr:hypothetical protein [Thermoanaerobaculia bacterium]